MVEMRHRRCDLRRSLADHGQLHVFGEYCNRRRRLGRNNRSRLQRQFDRTTARSPVTARSPQAKIFFRVLSGGAIYIFPRSSATITNSRSANNVAGDVIPSESIWIVQGGAIYSEGNLTIINTTFSGKTAISPNVRGSTVEGGAIHAYSPVPQGTMLAGSKPGNCARSVSGSYDLGDDASCRFPGTSLTTSRTSASIAG